MILLLLMNIFKPIQIENIKNLKITIKEIVPFLNSTVRIIHHSAIQKINQNKEITFT